MLYCSIVAAYTVPNKMLCCRSSTLDINPQEYISETMSEAGFPEELAKLQENLGKSSMDPAVYPRVTFLGTGSCIPNKTRNTSGILLEIK
jgi:ribonuclease Z